MKIASCLQYFLPGVPSLYYGDEAGMQGFEDPLNRRPYPWGQEDGELLAHYAMLGRLRKEYREEFTAQANVFAKEGKIYIERGRVRLCVDPKEITFEITKE